MFDEIIYKVLDKIVTTCECLKKCIKERSLPEACTNDEVKKERNMWRKTGNIAIEYECRGKKSGISVTQAEWWCHVLADDEEVNAMLMVPTDKMKSLARKYFKTKKMGGDDKQSKFVLIPLREVFNG